MWAVLGPVEYALIYCTFSSATIPVQQVCVPGSGVLSWSFCDHDLPFCRLCFVIYTVWWLTATVEVIFAYPRESLFKIDDIVSHGYTTAPQNSVMYIYILASVPKFRLNSPTFMWLPLIKGWRNSVVDNHSLLPMFLDKRHLVPETTLLAMAMFTTTTTHFPQHLFSSQ